MILIKADGRLAHEPELTLLPRGAVCEFRVLDTRYSKDGEQTEAVTFFCFDDDAEWFCQNAMKGQVVHIAGTQETRTWKPEGSDKAKHFVRYRTGRDFIQLGPRPRSAWQQGAGREQRSQAGSASAEKSPGNAEGSGGSKRGFI
jgi:single-stranded DNA-binding protein